MAADLELPASRSTRSTAPRRPSRSTSPRRPTTSSRSRPSRRARSSAACRRSTPCRPARSSAPNPDLFLHRQGPDPRASAPACRSASTPASSIPGGISAAARRSSTTSSRRFNAIGLACGNSGTPDGRLLPQGDQGGRRSASGLKFRIGGLGGQVLAKLGVVPQQIAARRRLSGARARHHRRRRVRRPLRRREARARPRSRNTTTAPGWWEGGAMLHLVVNLRQVGRAAEELSGDPVPGLRGGQQLDARPSTTCGERAGAARAWSAQGAELRRSRSRSWRRR